MAGDIYVSRKNDADEIVCGCAFCPLEGSIDATFSGYAGCGCVQGNDGNWYQVTAHTGLVGTFNIPITTPGTPAFFGPIGSVTLQKYTAEGCDTTDGDPEESTVNLALTCLDGAWNGLVTAANGTALGQFSAFFGQGSLSEPMTNEIECTTVQGGPKALFLLNTMTLEIHVEA